MAPKLAPTGHQDERVRRTSEDKPCSPRRDAALCYCLWVLVVLGGACVCLRFCQLVSMASTWIEVAKESVDSLKFQKKQAKISHHW